MRNDRPVKSESVSAVLRIWPPPSPREPSSTTWLGRSGVDEDTNRSSSRFRDHGRAVRCGTAIAPCAECAAQRRGGASIAPERHSGKVTRSGPENPSMDVVPLMKGLDHVRNQEYASQCEASTVGRQVVRSSCSR